MYPALIALALLNTATVSSASELPEGQVLTNSLLAQIVSEAAKTCSSAAMDLSINKQKNIMQLNFSDIPAEEWKQALSSHHWNEGQMQVARAVCEGYLAGYRDAEVDNMPTR